MPAMVADLKRTALVALARLRGLCQMRREFRSQEERRSVGTGDQQSRSPSSSVVTPVTSWAPAAMARSTAD